MSGNDIRFILRFQKELSILPDGANVWIVFNTKVKPNEPERVFTDAAMAMLWMASSGYASALEKRPFHIHRETHSDLSMLKTGHTETGEQKIREYLRKNHIRVSPARPIPAGYTPIQGRFHDVDCRCAICVELGKEPKR